MEGLQYIIKVLKLCVAFNQIKGKDDEIAKDKYK